MTERDLGGRKRKPNTVIRTRKNHGRNPAESLLSRAGTITCSVSGSLSPAEPAGGFRLDISDRT